MKKVLLLGGSYFQVPSVKKAKELGYYTITCDYLPDNPAHKFADEYHNVSTTDKEAVLKLAQELKIDGIVCYASDPAAPTAAYVAEKMGLAGHSYKSVEILSNKDLFRSFLSENGFNTPKAKGYINVANIRKDWDIFKKPVMVKPVDSSGSKGITKVEKLKDLDFAFEYALSFSRAKRVIVEEYIDAYGGQILGEGFSVNGELVFAIFANHFFDKKASNPFTPAGGCFPLNMQSVIQKRIKNEIQKVLTLLDMKTGAYNFEVRLDEQKNIYLMEIGPRNGGNMIPQLVKYATGFDMVEYTIKAAMGEDCSDLDKFECKNYWAYYVLHSNNSGIFQKLTIDEEFKKNNLVELNFIKNFGEKIETFSGSGNAIGIMILKFKTQEEMQEKINDISKYVQIKIEEKNYAINK
ncbi:MAG: ATP-grasp domain-containing protein [Candidatus Gastranaerophilales bacterium]|nr:ATP-grasp domain-containing protein [Candidatus Gastranaerophilales bacterium]